MKILHIIPSLHGGGAEKFCIDLCNEMSKQHDVTICSLFDVSEDMFMAKALSPRVKVITLNKKLGLDIKIFFKLFWLISRGNFDVVNTHLRALVYSIFAILFAKNSFFHTVHSMADKETSKINRNLYKILFQYFKVAPVAISKMVSDSIKAEYGQQYDICIENGVNKPLTTSKYDDVQKEISSYKPNASTKVFITIGRLVSEKNHIMLINVVNKLIEEGNDLLLLIIGDDPVSGKPMKQQLEQYKSKRIIFLGIKENVADYLLCSDVFCLSSLYEGLPITLLEAMSLGVITVCTPAGGIVNVIHDGENGWLSDDLSEEAFYKAIRKYLSANEDTRKKMSFNAKQSYDEKYNIVQTSNNYINLYRNI